MIDFKKTGLFLAVWAACITNIPAQLDPEFGDHGSTMVHRHTVEAFHSITVQEDGKILAAGYSGSKNGHLSALLLRFNEDGTPDPGFSLNGHFVYRVSDWSFTANSVAVQDDEKILLAGHYQGTDSLSFGENIFLMRLNSNGTIDSSFHEDGILTTELGKYERAVSVLTAPGGRIYLVVNSFSGDQSTIFVFAFQADGSPDTGFGQSGAVSLGISGSSWNHCYAACLQSDGKILIGGESVTQISGSNFMVMRLNADGSLDSGFSGDGKTTNSLGSKDDVVLAITALPNGKILTGGYYTDPDNHLQFAMVQYLSNGSLDPSFSGDGKLISFIENSGSISKICLAPNGDILALGSVSTNCGYDFAVSRYTPAGELISTFGTGGYFLTDFAGFHDGVSDGFMLSNGKLLAAGSMTNPVNSISDMVLARYDFDLQVSAYDPGSALSQIRVFPNPAHAGTIYLEFSLSTESDVFIDLYSITGLHLTRLTGLDKTLGAQQISVNLPENLPPGCYLIGVSGASSRNFVKLIIE